MVGKRGRIGGQYVEHDSRYGVLWGEAVVDREVSVVFVSCAEMDWAARLTSEIRYVHRKG